MNELRKRRRVSLSGFSPSLTEQSHKKSCDIHNILKKYRKTGMLNHVSSMEGKYQDYGTSLDFHRMQLQIANAKSMFESIPSEIRAVFHNNPGVFLDFATNPENREKMLEMGFSIDHLPEKVEEPPVIPPEPGPEPAPNSEPTPEPSPGPEATP